MQLTEKPNIFKLFILVALDLVGVSGSFFAGYFLNFGGPAQSLVSALVTINVYGKIFLFNSFLWLLIFNLFGLYQLEKKTRIARTDLILSGTTLGLILSLTATYIYPEFTYAKFILLVAWLLASGVIVLLRNLYLKVILK